MQGVWVQSLVGELRSHMLHGTAKKKEKKTPKKLTSKRKKIKIKAEINKRKISKTRSWFFEKINKINKPLN